MFQSSLSSIKLILLIFTLAVAVRIALIHAVIGFHHGQSNLSILNGDERDYVRRAENLLAGEGFTGGGRNDRMWRTPAYPVFLASVFLPRGRQLAVVRLLHAMLGGLVCVLIYAIARRVFDPTVAALSALYFAFFPPHAYMAGQILSENLLLPIVLLATLEFLRMMEQPSFQSAALCGSLAGLAALTKPEAGGIAAAMLAVLWLGKREKEVSVALLERESTKDPIKRGIRGNGGIRGEGLRVFRHFRVFRVLLVVLKERRPNKFLMSVALAFCAALVVAPWLARNYRLSGRVVISSVGGEAFWGGNNRHVLDDPKYRGYWMAPSEMPEQLKLVLAAPSELEQDRVRWRLGLEFLDSHHADIPRLVCYKFTRFHSVMAQDRTERLALILSFGWLLPFIAAGVLIHAWRFVRRRQAASILIAIIFYYNLLAIVFWGANRMRLVIDPLLIIFGLWAACAVVRFGLKIRSGSRPPEFS